MFQKASKREIRRVSCGTLVLTAAELAFFALLSAFELVEFNARIVVSSLLGAAIAVANFAVLCLTVQRAAKVSDSPGRVKAIVQISYNLRILFVAAWVVISFLVPFLHVIAGVLPLLFPRLTLYYLQATGKYAADSSAVPEAAQSAGAADSETPASPAEEGTVLQNSDEKRGENE